MAQVSLTVNGRAFAVTCEDGQEARIRRLGQYIEAKVAEFVRGVGQVGEARLLLLSALVIADELADAEEARMGAKRPMPEPPPPPRLWRAAFMPLHSESKLLRRVLRPLSFGDAGQGCAVR
jgi:cell division protein ZapA